MLAIVLASKDNTIANPHIYLRRNWVILNKTSLALMFTSDLKKIFHLLSNQLFFAFHLAVFRFVSLHYDFVSHFSTTQL